MLNAIRYISNLFFFARAGGGGHGGGGYGGGSFGGGGFSGGGYGGSSSGAGGGGLVGLIIFVIFFVFIVTLYFAWYLLMRKKQIAPAPENMDAELIPGLKKADIAQVFYAFQKDWSDNNSPPMAAYLTKGYHYNVSLMLAALAALKRQNLMTDVSLTNVSLIRSPTDTINMVNGSLIVEIKAFAKDSLIDLASSSAYYSNASIFSEYWTFVQEDSRWKLANIQQTTMAENVLHPAIVAFAQANNYFYSGEWGSLLLPTRGQLFSTANFAVSAVNDHVIGLYKNTIIEFYSYLPNKNYPETHTIAQAVLPKSYGNIVVHNNSGLLNLTPKGLKKVSTEWPDFNKKYNVYASDLEQATSFELLNPSFMVNLEALPFELNIEVADNIVYLHTKQTLDDYTPMLKILYASFQEMKM